SPLAREIRGTAAVRRNGNSQRDSPDHAIGNQPRGVRNVPRNPQFLRENIRSPSREQRHGDLASSKAVDDFIDGAIATACDHHSPVLLDSLLRAYYSGFAANGRRELGRNSRVLQQADCLLDLCKAAMTPTPTGWVIDQKRVFDSVGH